MTGCLVLSRAFRRYPICRHCSGVRISTHIGALCSHGTKNNQHNSTQLQTQPCTVSDGDICSKNKMYGGFRAAMANLLHRRDHAAPARAVASLAAVHAPRTKKPPPSLSLSTPGSPSTPTSARRSLTWLCQFCRLQCPLQRLHLFLTLPSTRLRRAHLWRRSPPRPSCRACCGARPSIQAVFSLRL